MPEIITAPVTETQQTVVTSTAAAASDAPVRGTQQDIDRAALYEKHYGSPPPPADTTTVSTSTASAAQADPTLASTAPAGVSPETFAAAIAAIQNEFAALRQDLRPAPVTSTSSAAAEPGWITKLRDGDIAGAESALAIAIAGKLQGPTVEQAVSRAREIARAESNIESFVKDLRVANPEIADMEPFIAMDAQQRLAVVQAAGTIKSTDDAVREYKKAVIDATESARKIAQKLRGSGKTEAMTRNREVLSASTINPQQVDANRTQQTTDTEPVAETTESYFEKRKALESQRKGLAVS
jgi:hypothetical protein